MKREKNIGRDAADRPAWYVLRTYPGFEKKAKTNLENGLKAKCLESRVTQVLIPSGDEEGNKPAFSGFLLLRMQMDDQVWSVARNTPGVTGFVGMGNTPTPFYTANWKAIPLQRFAN